MKLNLKNSALVLLAALTFVGCKNEDVDRHHFDNKVYISASTFTDELLIKAGVTEASRQLQVATAKPAPEQIEVVFGVAPELLDTYRMSYDDKAAVLLPEECYLLEDPVSIISAGSVAGSPVTVEFSNMNLLDRDIRYVLPVTVRSISSLSLLPSAKNFYYVFKGAALINVVADLTQNRAYPEFPAGNPLTNLSMFTLEALVNCSQLNKQISTIMGIEGSFLVRIGDAGVPSNQIQIASSRNLTNSALQLELDRWYHVAVTFQSGNVKVYIDGVEKCSGNVGKSTVNLGVTHSDESDNKPRCFWFGYSYDGNRYLEGKIAEARIWTRALTAEEINAPLHFYQVEPDAEGLYSYWKFDDGAGSIVKDYTANGNHLKVDKEPIWTSVSLPEKN